jgi:hypothetical protein
MASIKCSVSTVMIPLSVALPSPPACCYPGDPHRSAHTSSEVAAAVATPRGFGQLRGSRHQSLRSRQDGAAATAADRPAPAPLTLGPPLDARPTIDLPRATRQPSAGSRDRPCNAGNLTTGSDHTTATPRSPAQPDRAQPPGIDDLRSSSSAALTATNIESNSTFPGTPSNTLRHNFSAIDGASQEPDDGLGDPGHGPGSTANRTPVVFKWC